MHYECENRISKPGKYINNDININKSFENYYELNFIFSIDMIILLENLKYLSKYIRIYMLLYISIVYSIDNC